MNVIKQIMRELGATDKETEAKIIIALQQELNAEEAGDV